MIRFIIIFFIERNSNIDGIGPSITDLLASYLRGLTQRVNVDGATSGHLHLLDSAVQGSEKGCKLYVESSLRQRFENSQAA